jgi:hypothetical protein
MASIYSQFMNDTDGISVVGYRPSDNMVRESIESVKHHLSQTVYSNLPKAAP